MAFDRETMGRRVRAMVAHGYATHRVSNRILDEVATEIINTVFDELERTGIVPKEKK